MNERLFARLAALLDAGQPTVLASVLATRGATPRKAGARMLIGATHTEFSIGGGLAEARVIAAARELLERGADRSEVEIDLSGGVGAAGVCGGSMQLALRVWSGGADRQRAAAIARTLASGASLRLDADDVGATAGAGRIEADARLLIVGGGHCGLALYQLARYLDFDLAVFDPRPDYADPAAFPGAQVASGDFDQLRPLLATERALYLVLLNRDFGSDVASLRVIAGHRFAFLGMMGSRRRIAQVLGALTSEEAQSLAALQAPVGLPIGAQTPHEIAVSVLAHVLQARAA